MNNHWYFKHNGNVVGPVKLNELKMLHKGGHISSNSSICRKGMKDWISFQQLMSSTQVFAPISKRLGAFCVDLVVVFFLVVLLFTFLNVTLLTGSFEHANINPFVLYTVFGLSWLSYDLFFILYKKTTTLGKKLFNIAVANSQGKQAIPSKLILRSSLKILLLIVVDFFRLSDIIGMSYLALLLVFVPFGMRKQTIYDYVSDTLSLRTR